MLAPRLQATLIGITIAALLTTGCKFFSDRLTRWNMLDQSALEDPLKAIGGDGIVFTPKNEDRPMTRDQLASAKPQELIAYYSPIFIQQRVDPSGQPFPYPKEFDQIGEASLQPEGNGKYKGVISGSPKVYQIYQKRPINGKDHVQLTYTAWYPAHPRMKTIDLESASIDSCVVRITLDNQNVPLFYETIAACGCFHKVFVTRWLEDAAKTTYSAPEKGKKFVVERTAKDKIDWEVAGVVDESRDQPRRPVVFIKAGDHKVLGMGSRSRLKVPTNADVRTYDMTDYADLYAVRVEGSNEKKPFFDLADGGKVYGAQRKERFLFSVFGVDGAGQPRANEQIKLHFDQSDWDDTTTYSRYLRLPPGAL